MDFFSFIITYLTFNFYYYCTKPQQYWILILNLKKEVKKLKELYNCMNLCRYKLFLLKKKGIVHPKLKFHSFTSWLMEALLTFSNSHHCS